jgi:hypothetical protein
MVTDTSPKIPVLMGAGTVSKRMTLCDVETAYLLLNLFLHMERHNLSQEEVVTS